MRDYAVDEQTGELYPLNPENPFDRATANASALYLLLMLAFFLWQLFDIWIGRHTLAHLTGYHDANLLSSPPFLLAVYTFVGGGLGAIANGIRSLVVWHCERFAFGQRFVWKYLTAPWLGATLGLFVYALIRGGIVVFGGQITEDSASISSMLSAFAVGVLAGYGSHDVFRWLDAQVTKLFRTGAEVKVPDLVGMTREEAASILQTVHLELGDVSEEPQEDEAMHGKIIRQAPSPGAPVSSGGTIAITIAVKEPEQPADQPPEGGQAPGSGSPLSPGPH